MEPIEIPQYVDDPPNLLFWQVDEIAPIGIGLVLGMFLDQAGLCTLAGIALTRVYRKFRDARPDGFLAHALYWYSGLSGAKKAVTFPNPFIILFRP